MPKLLPDEVVERLDEALILSAHEITERGGRTLLKLEIIIEPAGDGAKAEFRLKKEHRALPMETTVRLQ